MMGSRKLSLVASFDDLCRNTAVLTKGSETDFIRFVANQEKCRLKWLETEQKQEQFQIQMSRLEAENDVLRTKLKHVRNDLALEMKRRTVCEQEKASLQRQIQLVRELLMSDNHGRSMLTEDKLAFLNDSKFKNKDHHDKLSVIDESNCSMSDISYDKSEELLDVSYLRSGRKWKGRDGKRRRMPSAPPVELDADSPPKRHRNPDHNTSITTTTTINVPYDVDSGAPITARAQIHTDTGETKKISYSTASNATKYHRRSRSTGSELVLNSNVNNYQQSRVGSTDNILKDCTNAFTPTANGTPLVRTNSSSSRLHKGHIFVTKTAIRPENCGVCNKRFNFGGKSMKCRDCRASCHPDCKDRLPLPCIPATPSTPGLNKHNIGVLADYAPLESPMIPAIVIMCVREVESRGLSEPGIYRVPGSDRDAKELKEKFFRRKGTPNLSGYPDIHVICCCLKMFLRGLKEPILTLDLWSDFVGATERNDRDESLCQIYQAVSMLPQANRDTLAYLILHFKKVSRSEDCKMPISNLAKVLGPTVVGYSTNEPTPMQMITETKKQANVIELLMSIEDGYWSAFINEPDANPYRSMQFTNVVNSPQTPEPAPDPRSILGPVNGRIHDMSRAIHQTPAVNEDKIKFKRGPRHFFSSPSLN